MLGPPLFLLLLVMVHLEIRKGIIDVRGYDDIRRIWKGGLIFWMKGSWLVGGEDHLEIEKVLLNLRVVRWILRRILRIWK